MRNATDGTDSAMIMFITKSIRGSSSVFKLAQKGVDYFIFCS
jgi:hypothetical protein